MDGHLVIDWIRGNCPVQAEGYFGGDAFYFRARGNRWSISIGEDVTSNPNWYYEEPYGAGWMSKEEANTFIHKAINLLQGK